MRAAFNEHQSLCEEIKRVLSPLLNDDILTAETLLKHGIITEAHSRSLYDDDWAEDEEEVSGDIAACKQPVLRPPSNCTVLILTSERVD